METPDLGAGRVFNYSWPESSKLYKSEIQYTCSQGRAFDAPPYNNSIAGDCKQQTTGSTQMNWKYNDANKLPNCIREYFQCCLILILPSLLRD